MIIKKQKVTRLNYKNRWSKIIYSVVLFTVFVFSETFSLNAEDGPMNRIDLRVGFGYSSFLNVNITDAKAAFKAFTHEIGKEKGYDLDVVVETFDSQEAFEQALNDPGMHLVIMKAWDYLSNDLSEYIEPKFVSQENGFTQKEYILLTRRDESITDLKSLEKKNIIILENTNCEMSRNWISTIILDKGLGDIETFFSEIKFEKKPTLPILSVYFKKTDACVVSRPVFDVVCDLNPQLKKSLEVSLSSKPLVDSMIFIGKSTWKEPRHRSDMIETLLDLHKETSGKQILSLFKADKMVPFEENMITNTRLLRQSYERTTVGRK